MERLVLLIGIDHKYQFGAKAVRTRTCTPLQEAEFLKLLNSVVQIYRPVAIAEELNEQALKEASITISVPQTLGLPHRFCEPNRREREQLGITSEETLVRARAFLNNKTPEQTEALVLAEFHKREMVWLERIVAFDKWPLLFVCGARHVAGFTELLAERGLSVNVIHQDWVAA